MAVLVYQKDDEVVTDSITVAETFDKRHNDVLRDIRNLDCSEQFSQRNFAQSTYINERGRQYESIVMKQDGFAFLVMGYTGKRAAAFKEDFINQFNELRRHINSQVKAMDERTALRESLKLTIETSERADKMEEQLEKLNMKVDEQITLDYGEQRAMQKAIAKRVYQLESDIIARKKVFSQIHREIKDRFAVSSYKDVRRKDFSAALGYINNFIPKRVA